ncbi:MAG TPA: hypothetical protein DIU07_13125 [Rhodobacteraceae bacterium]|nr:hypothetical protein [Paracoccaceae bacterium]
MKSVERNRTTGRDKRADRRRKADAPGQVLLGWVALMIVLALTLRNGAHEPPMWSLLCLATLLLFAVQVVFDALLGLRLPARAAVLVALPYVAVLAWLLVQSLPNLTPGLAHPFWAAAPDGALPTISAHPDAGRQVVMRLACYGMLFWIFLRSADAATEGGYAYIQAIALFSTALAIYGFVTLSIGYNLLLGQEQVATIMQASFLNRNTYATFAVFGVLANLTAYARAVSGSRSRDGLVALRDFLEAFFSSGWIYAFGTLVGLAAVAMTLSRGGVAAGAVGVAVLIWGLYHGARGASEMKLGRLVIPLVIFVFVAVFMTSGVLARLAPIETELRSTIFRHVLAGALDRPLLGHGAGTYPEASRFYMPLELARSDTQWAHNSYLENAFEFGLPAAALFFAALGVIGWRLFQGTRTRRRNQAIPAFALACFVAAAVHASVDFSLQFPAIAALFAAILGVGWAQSFSTRRGEPGKARRPRVDEL